MSKKLQNILDFDPLAKMATRLVSVSNARLSLAIAVNRLCLARSRAVMMVSAGLMIARNADIPQ